MNFAVSSEWSVASSGLVWGVVSTCLWLWIVLRVITALDGLARAHAELANALHRIAERLPDKDAGPADTVAGPADKDAGPGDMDWPTDQPPPHV
jgi:hypothetical protein